MNLIPDHHRDVTRDVLRTRVFVRECVVVFQSCFYNSACTRVRSTIVRTGLDVFSSVESFRRFPNAVLK